MILDTLTAHQVAQALLDAEAVKLNLEQPFQWASGWLSPIYCDNRRTLSYPFLRTYIKLSLAKATRELYPEAEVIAGVATGAISWGMLVADALGLPFVYVRPKPKDHGLKRQVEGFLPTHAKVAVIEDLISTGGSSIQAISALRQEGAEVLGLLAVYTHGFAKAEKLFEENHCTLATLSNYQAVIEEAVKRGVICPSEEDLLKKWREAPETWGR